MRRQATLPSARGRARSPSNIRPTSAPRPARRRTWAQATPLAVAPPEVKSEARAAPTANCQGAGAGALTAALVRSVADGIGASGGEDGGGSEGRLPAAVGQAPAQPTTTNATAWASPA